MKTVYNYLVTILCLLSIGCLPEEPDNSYNFSIKDEKIQEIIRFQDERNTDELLGYTEHPNITYRYAVANALASVQDEKSVSALVTFLKDEDERVRYVAAYALGQTKSADATKPILKSFGEEKSRKVQGALLEAIGKTGDKENLRQISTVRNYRETDTLLLEGQSKGIYRFMTRDITLPEGTTRMIELLQQNTPSSVKQVAADYLRRAKDIKIAQYEKELIEVFEKEATANVRMFLASALGKTKQDSALVVLSNAFDTEKDYRVKVNMIRALRDYPYKKARDLALKAAEDNNPNVAYTAAAYLRKNAAYYDSKIIYKLAEATQNWRVKSELFAAALARTNPAFTKTRYYYSRALIRDFEGSKNPYEKGALLIAMAENPVNLEYIEQVVFDSMATPVIKSYGIQALAEMRINPELDQLAGSKAYTTKARLAQIFKRAIESGDVAMIATTSGILRQEELKMRRAYPGGAGFMDNTLKKLQLPRDVEAYNELKRTINYFRGFDIERGTITPEAKQPIDWELINNLPKAPTAIISTKKGNIEIDLLASESPGSVANFVKLAQDGFFKNKNFHRIVPNFVAQGGCPRGDGWGSLDYSIRSELGPQYYNDEGYIGMASAGKDTECTQWFITHSPTHHLDGRYTIFAKVSRGMDIVHKLEIGDIIESVEIR